MTQHFTEQHLTEEEFSDYLLGLSTSTTRAHLLECAHCREEMESFGASMASFNQLSLNWSRERAAAQPIHIETHTTPGRRVSSIRHAGWAAGLAVAAVLAFAVALPMALMHEHSTHTNIASTSAPAAVTPASAIQPQATSSEIAEDNQMMAAIDAEISQPDLSPVESFATFRPQHTSLHDGRPAVRKKS